MERYNFAVIGCGRISYKHIEAIADNIKDAKLVALCDTVAERAEKEKAFYISKTNHKDNPSVYTDYREMLKNEKIDIITIATESGSHAEISLYCTNFGKHVIVEKPIALSVQDTDKMIKSAEENNVVLSVCHQNRFNIAVQEMRMALESNRFGKLSHGSVHIRWNRDKNYYEQAPWRGTWAQDGGALMNQCIHGIDLLRWMCGDEIVEVYGQTRHQFHDYLEVEDVGLAVIKFKNGVIATIEGTTNVYPKNLEETLYLFGEKGTVKLGGKSCNNIDVWNFADENESDEKNKGLKEITANVYGNGHSNLFADVIDAVKHKRKPYIDAYAGKQALELVLAIYKSQKEQQPVKLPLEEFSCLDMDGEFI